MFAELIEWVMNLDPGFAFLLALPFAVALAGLLAEGVRKPSRGRQDTGNKDVPHAPRHMHTHVWSR
jgi:hypothetical protein